VILPYPAGGQSSGLKRTQFGLLGGKAPQNLACAVARLIVNNYDLADFRLFRKRSDDPRNRALLISCGYNRRYAFVRTHKRRDKGAQAQPTGYYS